MQHPILILIAVAGLFRPTPLHAYERLQGPTEVIFWNKTNTFNGYTFFGVRSNAYLVDMEGRVMHTWPVGTNPHAVDERVRVADLVTAAKIYADLMMTFGG